MTEIVQNNNSMKFDLLETGNGSPSASEDHDFFNRNPLKSRVLMLHNCHKR